MDVTQSMHDTLSVSLSRARERRGERCSYLRHELHRVGSDHVNVRVAAVRLGALRVAAQRHDLVVPERRHLGPPPRGQRQHWQQHGQ